MPNPNLLPITVYGTPNCVQCNATYRYMDSHNIQYRKVDVTESENALAYVKSLGYEAAPVVVVPMDWPSGGSHWSGFNPGNLQKLLG